MKKSYLIWSILSLTLFGLTFYFTPFNQSFDPNPHKKHMWGEQENEAANEDEFNIYKQKYDEHESELVVANRDAFIKKHGSLHRLLSPSIVLNANVFANWTECGPNGAISKWPGDSGFIANGKLIAIEQDYSMRNILYAGASGGGLWRSTDNGATWDIANDNLPCHAVSTIACNPGVPGEVWMGTGAMFNGDAGGATPLSGYLYKSTDYGLTWTQVTFTTSSPVNSQINKIVIPLLSPNFICIAAENGCFVSVNHGNTFQKVAAAGTVNITDAVDVSDSSTTSVSKIRVLLGIQNTTTLKRLTWNTSTPTSSIPNLTENIVCTPIDSIPYRIALTSSRTYSHSYVYASFGSIYQHWAGMWLSPDKGSTFDQVNIPSQSSQMTYNLCVGVHNYDSNLVFAGTNHTVLDYSDDATYNWKTTLYPAGIHADHHAFCSSWTNNDTIYMVGDAGVYVIKNKGLGYTTPGKLRNFLVRNLAINPTNPLDRYVATWDNGIYHVSNGNPLEYEWVGCCDGVDMAYSPTRHLFTIANGGMYKWDVSSVTYANNNAPFNSGFTGYGGNNVMFNGTNFYANQGLYVYKTNGINAPWTKVGGINKTFVAGVWHMDATSTGVVAGVTWGGSTIIPIRVTDSLGNFMPPTIGPSATASWWAGKTPWQVKFGLLNTANNKYRLYAVLQGTSGKLVVMSDDGGASYKDITGNLPQNMIDANCILPDDVNPNIIYLGSSVGVFATLDGGVNWFNYSDNLPMSPHLTDLDFATINGTKYIFASTYGRSVWYSPTVDSTMLGINKNIDKTICTLFPNPATDVFHIALDDAQAKNITVSVFDINASKVLSNYFAANSDALKMNCTSLKPGVYLVVIQYNNKKIIRKLLKN
jgi:hypothetical protein